MHAIEITRDNLPKITEADVTDHYFNTCNIMVHNAKRWYLVKGYVDHRGKLVDWVVLPAYIIEKFFEHDPVKIKTDWDQIVRN